MNGKSSKYLGKKAKIWKIHRRSLELNGSSLKKSQRNIENNESIEKMENIEKKWKTPKNWKTSKKWKTPKMHRKK